MAVKKNMAYWEISLKHPEKVIDNYYVFNEIIVSDKDLIEKFERLRELIISYCVVYEKNKSETGITSILDEIFDIITTIDRIQYNEFIAFWKTLDISHSIFKKLSKQKPVLKELLDKYCKERRKLYDKLGYSNIVAQTLYDDGSSRKKGNAGINKLEDIIEKIFLDIKKTHQFNEFIDSSCAYLLPDKKDKKLANEFYKKYKIEFEF
ncbi:hypothetical protein J7L68_02135 [bacterium]|nr:hypothetical protein [bacterium]